jgi:hypothetical protein
MENNEGEGERKREREKERKRDRQGGIPGTPKTFGGVADQSMSTQLSFPAIVKLYIFISSSEKKK